MSSSALTLDVRSTFIRINPLYVTLRRFGLFGCLDNGEFHKAGHLIPSVEELVVYGLCILHKTYNRVSVLEFS